MCRHHHNQPNSKPNQSAQIPNEPIGGDESKQATIECNISKLLELPWEQCPWPAVRSRMLRLAIEGAEIYAYRPAFSKKWVIWYPLEHQPRSQYSPHEWARLHGYAVDKAVDKQVTGQVTDKEGA